jgi:hypothetical protein
MIHIHYREKNKPQNSRNQRQDGKDNLRAETDRLWVRIEALQWALAQILALRQ